MKDTPEYQLVELLEQYEGVDLTESLDGVGAEPQRNRPRYDQQSKEHGNKGKMLVLKTAHKLERPGACSHNKTSEHNNQDTCKYR